MCHASVPCSCASARWFVGTARRRTLTSQVGAGWVGAALRCAWCEPMPPACRSVPPTRASAGHPFSHQAFGRPLCEPLPSKCAGVKAHPASLVGAEALKIAAGSHSDEVVRLYLD